MADSRVVSKIVTQLLIDTCRQRNRWNIYVVKSLNFCHAVAAVRFSDDVEFAVIPLIAGSVAEFYITPMYRYVGDLDIMFYFNNELAIPAGCYPPPRQLPEQFHSCVKVFDIIDSKYPGYVYLVSSYLLTESIEDDMYNVMPCCPSQYYELTIMPSTYTRVHGPAALFGVSRDTEFHVAGFASRLDFVRCVRCLSWPPQAATWPTRHRLYDWPDSAIVNRVVNNGCDVVRVAHHMCRDHEWENKNQWRLSFSRAEVVLLSGWKQEQQIVYHMLRAFTDHFELSSQCTDSKMFSNYNIKTLLLWACELKPDSWWTDDLNLVRISVALLHNLAVWLTESRCPHYFITNCNLFDHHDHNSHSAQLTASWLLSVTELSLAIWFVDVYAPACAQQHMFDYVSPLREIAAQRSMGSLAWSMTELTAAQGLTAGAVHDSGITVQSCIDRMTHVSDLGQRLSYYFTAVVFLHVAYKKNWPNDEFVDVLATTCLQTYDARRCFKARHSSVLSLSQTAKLMKVVANNSRSKVQLIVIELSKAYLYRALRYKDADNDSIYCLANVYLAVLYYTTGQYQTAIDHCTLVARSHDHSQCSSHVVQGELLPKIDDNMDNVLGLAVFYQYVQTAALNQQRQKQVGVFCTELFASYLHIRCLSVTECRQFTQMSSADEIQRRHMSLCDQQVKFTTDVLLWRIMNSMERVPNDDRQVANSHTQRVQANVTLEFAGLLQQSAVEYLTAFRKLEAREFGPHYAIMTTDFEALYAYKRGDYPRCLELTTHNVQSVIGRRAESFVFAYPEFIQLMDDDIASLTGLTLLAQPACRKKIICHVLISQLSLSLDLMIECQMKLHHSGMSLARTLDYIQVARRLNSSYTLDQLMMKLAERKLVIYISVHC